MAKATKKVEDMSAEDLDVEAAVADAAAAVEVVAPGELDERTKLEMKIGAETLKKNQATAPPAQED